MSTRVVIAGYNSKRVVSFVAVNILTLGFFLAVITGVFIFAFHEIRDGTYQGRNLLTGVVLYIIIGYVIVKQINLILNYKERAAAFIEDGRFYFLHKHWGWVPIKDVNRVDHEPGKIYFLMKNDDVKALSTDLLDLSAEEVSSKINNIIAN